ncbi:transposase InsO family protein [Neobacillus sp. B4I6]
MVAYHLSSSLDIVYKTLIKLKEAIGEQFHPDVIFILARFSLHPSSLSREDQKIKVNTIMCRKGNCWDTAPIESFFNHLK